MVLANACYYGNKRRLGGVSRSPDVCRNTGVEKRPLAVFTASSARVITLEMVFKEYTRNFEGCIFGLMSATSHRWSERGKGQSTSLVLISEEYHSASSIDEIYPVGEFIISSLR